MKDVCLNPTVKHRGVSIMVCRCLTTNCMGDLVRVDRIMNAEKYRHILIHYAILSGKRLIRNSFIF